MSQSRFVVGIDLGTTNSALSYFDTGAGDEPTLRHLGIPQVTQPGVVEERPLLPSFLYLPGPNEQPAGSLNLPWASGRDYCVGEFARNFGSQVPTRLVSSAKSWLSHPGVDRKEPILPWKAPENGRHVSPLEATTYYLKHLVDAWNYLIAKDVADHRLENQEIILTVPASFDAVARDLTVEAAQQPVWKSSPFSKSRKPPSTPGSTSARTAGASRLKSATSSWFATLAAAPPTFP